MKKALIVTLALSLLAIGWGFIEGGRSGRDWALFGLILFGVTSLLFAVSRIVQWSLGLSKGAEKILEAHQESSDKHQKEAHEDLLKSESVQGMTNEELHGKLHESMNKRFDQLISYIHEQHNESGEAFKRWLRDLDEVLKNAGKMALLYFIGGIVWSALVAYAGTQLFQSERVPPNQSIEEVSTEASDGTSK